MDFTQALNIKTDEVERPPVAPTGHYRWRITKYAFGEVGNGRFDTVDFTMQAVEADEDVDPGDLQNVGGVAQVRTRNRFILGIAEGTDLKEAIDQSINCECLGNIQHRPDPQNAEIVYAEIGRTAPVA
jgi:hypothetical protein